MKQKLTPPPSFCYKPINFKNFNNFDLTGKKQHGFKSGRSTITAGLALQSLIARALDNDEYYVMGSLDLSTAFYVVDRDLLCWE